MKLFLNNKLNKIEYAVQSGKDINSGNEYYYLYSNEKVTCDYIGPSVKWAYKSGFNDNEIGKFLKEAQTFAGHIVWTTRKYLNGTINTARGGEKGFCDRIDFTLFDLKKWYDWKNNILQNSEDIKLLEYFNVNEDWLMKYRDFNGYVDYFVLKNSFVNEKYEVYDLASYKDDRYEILPNKNQKTLAKYSKDEYKNYVSGNLNAIKLRNEQISN
jgi:glycosyltransferase involved in cell wall biosynthesis